MIPPKIFKHNQIIIMTHRTTSCPCSHITMNVNKHTNIPQHEVFFVGPYIHDCVIFHFDTPSCLRCAVYKQKSQIIGCLRSLHVDIIMSHHPTAQNDKTFHSSSSTGMQATEIKTFLINTFKDKIEQENVR